MVKRAFRVSIGLLLVVGGVACSSSTKGGGSTTTSAGASQASITALDARRFSPDRLTVSVGQTVTWTNGGSLSHTVTFDGGPAFDQPLNGGSTVTRMFTAAGTFAYHCRIHGPSMHGTIVVK